MSGVMIWDDEEDDCYDDDPVNYGCGIPGCSCMTDDLYEYDEEDDVDNN